MTFILNFHITRITTVILAFLLTEQLNAQPNLTSWGIHSGITYNNFVVYDDCINANQTLGYQLGVDYSFLSSYRLYANTEASYTTYAADFSLLPTSYDTNTKDIHIRYHRINLGLFLSYHFAELPNKPYADKYYPIIGFGFKINSGLNDKSYPKINEKYNYTYFGTSLGFKLQGGVVIPINNRSNFNVSLELFQSFTTVPNRFEVIRYISLQTGIDFR